MEKSCTRLMNRLAPIVLIVCLALAVACVKEESTPKPVSRREAYEMRKTREAQQQQTQTAEPPKAACPEKPNILIITLDTLRFDATSLAPNATNATPELAALAASGVQFTNAYSTHDSTPQSHASLFTGYVNALGNPALDRAEASIAYQLERIGYHTFASIANANLSPTSFATTRPFDDLVVLHDTWMNMTEAQKAKVSPPLDALMRHYFAEPTDWYRMMLYGDAERVLTRFETRLHRSPTPFFGFINLLDCHEPYFPDPKRYDMAPEKKIRKDPPPAPRYRTVSPELANPDSITDEKRRDMIKAKLALTNGRPWALTFDMDAAELKIYRMRYDAEVRQLDDAVKRIIATLDEAKLRDSTIVVITSDHGESFGEAGFLTHSLHDGGDLEATHRVPMIILFPPCYGIGPAKIDTHMTIADITPTIYDLLGIDATKIWARALPGEVGRSLLPLLRAKAATPSVPAASENWKAVSPQEKSKMDAEALKRLKALGYIQ